MAISVVMPALEMAQETGKLVSWKKKAGDQVKKGEMLLEIETDKAVVEIEAQGDGILGGVTAKEGDVVPVGQTIAWLLKPASSRRPTLLRRRPVARWIQRRPQQRPRPLPPHLSPSPLRAPGSHRRPVVSRANTAWTSRRSADRDLAARSSPKTS
jgi:pyruvate/2-oxoglutarate dehydrogenase complex dihydrolipoamide acyltransferase (E2) component